MANACSVRWAGASSGTLPYNTDEVPLSMIPSSGSSASTAARGSASTARIIAAVPPSVSSTVPEHPEPVAQPAARELASGPADENRARGPDRRSAREAPFPLSRKGRKVSRPMRTAVSRTPMAKSQANPPRPLPAAWSTVTSPAFS